MNFLRLFLTSKRSAAIVLILVCMIAAGGVAYTSIKQAKASINASPIDTHVRPAVSSAKPTTSKAATSPAVNPTAANTAAPVAQPQASRTTVPAQVASAPAPASASNSAPATSTSSQLAPTTTPAPAPQTKTPAIDFGQTYTILDRYTDGSCSIGFQTTAHANMNLTAEFGFVVNLASDPNQSQAGDTNPGSYVYPQPDTITLDTDQYEFDAGTEYYITFYDVINGDTQIGPTASFTMPSDCQA